MEYIITEFINAGGNPCKLQSILEFEGYPQEHIREALIAHHLPYEDPHKYDTACAFVAKNMELGMSIVAVMVTILFMFSSSLDWSRALFAIMIMIPKIPFHAYILRSMAGCFGYDPSWKKAYWWGGFIALSSAASIYTHSAGLLLLTPLAIVFAVTQGYHLKHKQAIGTMVYLKVIELGYGAFLFYTLLG